MINMESIVEKIVERLSAYEFLNNIIPGTVYIVITEKLTPFTLLTGNIWLDFVLFYFAGLVIGRVGSLFMDRILKKKRTVASYSEYVAAEKKDRFIRTLSAVNNMYRTYAAVALCLIVTFGFGYIWTWIEMYDFSKPVCFVGVCIVVIILFSKAYIKQSSYVAERVKSVLKLSKESKIVLPEEKDK